MAQAMLENVYLIGGKNSGKSASVLAREWFEFGREYQVVKGSLVNFILHEEVCVPDVETRATQACSIEKSCLQAAYNLNYIRDSVKNGILLGEEEGAPDVGRAREMLEEAKDNFSAAVEINKRV